MKTVLKRVIIAGVMLTLLQLSTAAFARPAGDGPPRGGRSDEMIKLMVEELELTKEQEEKLKAHRKEHKEEARGLFKALSEKQMELGDALEGEESDESKIRGVADEIKKIQSEMVDQRINAILKVKEILTPEQFKEFIKKTKNFKGKRGEHRRGKDRKRDKPRD